VTPEENDTMSEDAHPTDPADIEGGASRARDPAPGREVARLVEQLRLAEGRLARQRQTASGLNDSDKAAIRYILENDDAAAEITPSVMAASLHLTPPAMTVVLDRLVAAGFVTVTPHPTDRRKKLVKPFDRNIDPDHLDPVTTRLRAIASRLSTAEAHAVSSFLSDVIAVITDPELPRA
jgi:DNA-binding MarR family transcriptional regulator